MSDATDRLATLSAAELADLAATVVTARWDGGWRIDVAPPSPDGSADVRAERGDRRRLIRVRRVPASTPIGAPAVEEAAAFADRCGFEAAVFVAPGGFTPAAEAVEAPSLRLVDGDRLVAWADDAGVSIAPPDDGGTDSGPPDRSRDARDGDDATPLDDALDRYAAYWPEGLAARARAVSEAVVAAAPFDVAGSEGDASTEIACRLGGTVPVRLRFTETSFLVFVRDADGSYERALALTVHRRNRPPASTLVETIRSSVAGALDRERSDE